MTPGDAAGTSFTMTCGTTDYPFRADEPADAEAFAKKKKKKKGTKKRSKLGSDDFVLRDEDVAEEEPPTGGAQRRTSLRTTSWSRP